MANTSIPFLGSIRGRLVAGTAALALIPLLLLALTLGYYASRQSASALDQRAPKRKIKRPNHRADNKNSEKAHPGEKRN